MDVNKLSERPHVLELNRVERLYTGGKLLDKWQGIEIKEDSTESEEFIASTVKYIGPKKDVIDDGISRTKLSDGSYINLQQLIMMDKEAMLGKKYSKECEDGQMGVLSRVGDSLVRLVIQVHPTAEKARKYLNYPVGKTEAWYILDTREVNGDHPYIYAGFKKNVTKELFEEAFYRQDTQAMLNYMHRIEVNRGDVILIESGMPHAMGAGCLFLEVHEACDYTIRVEKNYSVRELTDDELHYGAGFEAMFDMFNYKTYSDEEILEKVIMKQTVLDKTTDATLSKAIDYNDTERFKISLLSLNGQYTLPEFDGHYVIITTKGDIKLKFAEGETLAEQGRGIFVPANCTNLTVEGNGEILIAYPFNI